MRNVNVKEMKAMLRVFIDLAKGEPVGIRTPGRLTAVLVSAEESEHFQRLDDGYWIARAEEAESRGRWVGHAERCSV